MVMATVSSDLFLCNHWFTGAPHGCVELGCFGC